LTHSAAAPPSEGNGNQPGQSPIIHRNTEIVRRNAEIIHNEIKKVIVTSNINETLT